MTPFGIRKKLKSMLGLGGSEAPAAPTKPSYEVAITAPDGSQLKSQGKEGDTLVNVTGRTAWPIMTGCAEGECGTCRVEVLAGMDSLAPMSDKEERTRAANKIEGNWRLGCLVRVQGPGVAIRVIDPFAEGGAPA